MSQATAALRLIAVAVGLVIARIDTAAYRRTRLLLAAINETISESAVNVTYLRYVSVFRDGRMR